MNITGIMNALETMYRGHRAFNREVCMLVLPSDREDVLMKAFVGKEYNEKVFDLRPDKHKKIHMYLHNVQVMFTKKLRGERLILRLKCLESGTAPVGL